MADDVVTIGLEDLEPLAALVVAPVRVLGRPIDFTVVAANESATRAMDPGASSIIGRSIGDHLAQLRPAGILQLYAEVITTGRPVHHHGLEVFDEAGELRNVWDAVLLPFGPGVLAVLHEITPDWEHDRDAADALVADTLLGERDRMARDLHDTVLQDVIAASMVLARIASTSPEVTADEIQRVIDIHDTAVAQLRATLYDLRQRDRNDLRRQVLDVVDAALPALGLEPLVTIAGSLPGTESLAQHVLAILGEVLSNIGRHAEATQVTVDLRVRDGHLVLTVTDDGVGIDPIAPNGIGLDNMRQRAVSVGGTCEVTSTPGGGTTVQCRVPVPSRHRRGDRHDPDRHEPNGVTSRRSSTQIEHEHARQRVDAGGAQLDDADR